MWLFALVGAILADFPSSQKATPSTESEVQSPSTTQQTGTAQAELRIEPDGLVVGCTIIKSSGNRAIDRQTCDILRKNVHFKCDKNGCVAGPVTWKIPQ